MKNNLHIALIAGGAVLGIALFGLAVHSYDSRPKPAPKVTPAVIALSSYQLLYTQKQDLDGQYATLQANYGQMSTKHTALCQVVEKAKIKFDASLCQ